MRDRSVESDLANAAAMKRIHHLFKSPERSVVCTVNEEPDRITFTFIFSKRGECGDEAQLIDWLVEIREKYRDDQRPITFANYLSPDAETAAATGNLALVAMVLATEA